MASCLTETERRQLNALLEDYSRLERLRFDLRTRLVDVKLSVCPDSETNAVHEHGEVLVWNTHYTFRLGNLSRIAISTGSEELPKEISSVVVPNARFMLFVASIFEASDIFEWQCFPERGSPTHCPQGGARWIYPLVDAEPEAQSYMELFKHREKALWAIGFWFESLQISDCEPISIEELSSRYPKRIGLALQ